MKIFSGSIIRLAAISFLALVIILFAGCETAPNTASNPPPPERSASFVAQRPPTLGSLGREDVLDYSKLDQPPAPIFQKKPVYPFEMHRNGIRGTALIDFVVDTEGNVRNARAVEANHESFADSAVKCVSGWKFRPGIKDGRPVNTHMRVPIVFDLGGEMQKPGIPIPPNAGPPISPNGTASAIFDVSQVDVAPTPTHQAKPRYPTELRRKGISGEALVDFIVDENGVVRNAHSIRETKPEFGAAAEESVSLWIFRPAQKDGHAVRTHLQVPVIFTLGRL